jgi:hypothetical protein
VVGALVTKHDFDGEVWGSFPDVRSNRALWWLGERTEVLLARRWQGTSDERGRVRIPAEVASPERPFLWVTSETHKPSLVVQSDGELAWPARVELDRSNRETFRVVDEEGQPVPGAVVRDSALVSADLSPAAWEEPEAMRRALVREYIADEFGMGVLHDLGGPHFVQAIVDTKRSLPLELDAHESCTLVVSETVRSGGQIQGAADFVLGPWAVVLVERLEPDGTATALGSAWAGQGQEWGPLELPRIREEERYRFELLQGGNVVEPKEREVPPMGIDLRVDFAPRRGADLWISVVNEADEPVFGAEVELREQLGGAGADQRRLESDSEGRAIFVGTRPDTSYRATVRHPDYASRVLLDVACRGGKTECSYLARLSTPTSVHGAVLHEGGPVGAFSVLAWEPGRIETLKKSSFGAEASGRFELAGLAPTTLYLQASVEAL